MSAVVPAGSQQVTPLPDWVLHGGCDIWDNTGTYAHIKDPPQAM
jgi:hypothetical protein